MHPFQDAFGIWGGQQFFYAYPITMGGSPVQRVLPPYVSSAPQHHYAGERGQPVLHSQPQHPSYPVPLVLQNYGNTFHLPLTPQPNYPLPTLAPGQVPPQPILVFLSPNPNASHTRQPSYAYPAAVGPKPPRPLL